MAFVDDDIRGKYLRSKKTEAETIIANLAVEHSCLANIPFTHLMYDATRLKDQKEMNLRDGRKGEFILNAARPTFATSDDALVDIAGKIGEENCSQAIFVTSDRELQLRLKEKKCNIMKPKCWFGLVKTLLGGDRYSKIIKGNQE